MDKFVLIGVDEELVETDAIPSSQSLRSHTSHRPSPHISPQPRLYQSAHNSPNRRILTPKQNSPLSFSRGRGQQVSSPISRPLFPPYETPSSLPSPSPSSITNPHDSRRSLSPRTHYGTTLRPLSTEPKSNVSSPSLSTRLPLEHEESTHSTFGKFSRWFRGHIHRKHKESSPASSPTSSPLETPRGLRTRHLAIPNQNETLRVPSLPSLQPIPISVCFASSTGCDANFLVNTLLKGSFSPPNSDSERSDEPAFPIDATFLPEPSFVRLAPEVFRREKTSTFSKIRKYMKEGVCKFTDPTETFILPQQQNESCPVLRLEYGTVSELYVRFPSEAELRRELWVLHCAENGSVKLAPNSLALLRKQYESVMGFSYQKAPKVFQSAEELPIPSSIARVLGKTHRYMGNGENAHYDRLYIRERLRSIIERMGSFVAEVIIRTPSTVLSDQFRISIVDFGVCNEGHLSSKGHARTKVFQSSNYFVVLVNPGEAFTSLHRESAFQELVQSAKKSSRPVDFVHPSCRSVLQKPEVDRLQKKLANSQAKMLSNMCCGHEIGNCSHFKTSTSLIVWPALFLCLPLVAPSPHQPSPLTLQRPVVDKMRSSSNLPLMLARMKCLSIRHSFEAAAWTHRRLMSFFQKSQDLPRISPLLLEGICVTENLNYFRVDPQCVTLLGSSQSGEEMTEEEAVSTEDDRLSLSHILNEDVMVEDDDAMGKHEEDVPMVSSHSEEDSQPPASPYSSSSHSSSSSSSSSPSVPSILSLFSLNSENRKVVQMRKNELKQNLDRLGLILGETNRSSTEKLPIDLLSDDANIQYRTIATQLYGTENAFQIVKTLILNEILSSENTYLPFLEGAALSLSEYTGFMLKDGVYGDHLTLYAAANAFETDIYLFSPLSPNPFIFRSRRPSSTGQPLLLCTVSAREYSPLVWKNPKKANPSDVLMRSDLSRSSQSDSIESDRKKAKSSPFSGGSRQSPKPFYFTGMTTLVDLCISTIGLYSEMLPPLDGLLPPELLQRILTHLLRIRVVGEDIFEKILDESIQTLDVSASPQITDRMCHVIAKRCPHLLSLSLANCLNVTNEGLRAVSLGCPLLESLDLEKLANITDDGIRVLAQGCPNLSSVNLSGCSQITNAALLTLYHSGQNLQALSLNGLSQITDPVFDLIHGITRLDLSDCQQLTDTAVERIAMNTHKTLESLVLQGGHFTDAGVCKLAMSCGRLTDLRISDCSHVTFETLRSLASSCRYLRTLSLKNCVNIIGKPGNDLDEKEEAGTPMSMWRSLETVDLDCCTNISDHTLIFIVKRSPKVKSLSLSSCAQLSDVSVDRLPQFCRFLERISLSNCVLISDKSVNSLSSLSHLHSLNLHNCNRITNQSIYSLALHSHKITKLDISWCPRLTDDAILQLRDGMRGIEDLNLEELPVSSYAISSLSSRCEMLRILNLAYTNTDADTLYRIVRGCSQLREIDVTGCRSLTIENVNCAIESLPNLRTLRIRWMDSLRSTSVSHLRLESLDVSFCKNFNRDGLMSTLHSCPSVHHVDIAWCTSLTHNDIYDFVRFSRNLRSLNLRGFPPLPTHILTLFQSKGVEIVK